MHKTHPAWLEGALAHKRPVQTLKLERKFSAKLSQIIDIFRDLSPSTDKRVYDDILGAIRKTPLIRLGRIAGELACPLYAKMELLNPGGSVKDRVGFYIINLDYTQTHKLHAGPEIW